MQNWLGYDLVLNGEVGEFAYSHVYWNRDDGDLFLTSASIEDYSPGSQGTFSLEQIQLGFDGGLVGSRQILTGYDDTVDDLYAGGAITLAPNSYKAVFVDETTIGFDFYAASASSPEGNLGSPKLIMSFSGDPANITAAWQPVFFGEYYAIGFSFSNSGGGGKTTVFQAFDPNGDVQLSNTPNFLDFDVDDDSAQNMGAWNSSWIVYLKEVDDLVEGNTDIQLSTHRVDGNNHSGDRDYIIDLDHQDIDYIKQYYSPGDIPTANMLILTTDNDVGDAGTHSRIDLSFVEDQSASSNALIASAGFDVMGSETAVSMQRFEDDSGGQLFLTFIDDGALTAIVFDTSTQTFGAKFTIKTGVSVDEFAGSASYGDGRFMVHWYEQGASASDRELKGTIVDTRTGPVITTGTDVADRLIGTIEDDRLEGGLENDYLVGGIGDDLLDGGDGEDVARYSQFQNALTINLGLTGPQLISAQAGSDELISIENIVAGRGADQVTGNSVANRIWGGVGEDALYGLGGNDHLYGGADDDELFGGDADDTLTGGTGADVINGGDGIDTASYEHSDSYVRIRLDLDVTDFWHAFHGDAEDDQLIGIENIVGSDFRDNLRGDDNANSLVGGRGGDHLYGGNGNDTLIGGEDEDYLFGGNGDDKLEGGAGRDNLQGGNGNNTLIGGADGDRLRGGDGNDKMIGGSGGDRLRGENGKDELIGGSGADWLNGGRGNDKLNGGAGFDRLGGDEGNDRLVLGTGSGHLDGGAGNDHLIGGGRYSTYEGGTGNDRIEVRGGSGDLDGGAGRDLLIGGGKYDHIDGGNGNDRLISGGGGDRLFGGNGNDRINSSGGSDWLEGGNGNDRLSSGSGGDRLYGGSGNDHLSGDAGKDLLYGGTGKDVLKGGGGSDSFIFDDRWGRDTITDFRVNQDKLNFVAVRGLKSEDDLKFSMVKGDLTISLGANKVVLDGLDRSDIDDLSIFV